MAGNRPITVHSSCDELPITNVQKEYSENLFHALCAHSKYLCQTSNNDFGVDLKIEQLIVSQNGNSYHSGPELLSFQVKSSKNWELSNGNIKYQLDNKAFNAMVYRNQKNLNPLIVILCCLPEKHEDWIEYQNYTTLFTNYYWYKTDETELKENENSRTTVYIPSNQRVEKNTITQLIEMYNVQPIIG